jgi:hypothetical protein
MKEHPMRLAPVAWPHDGGKGAGIITGDTIKATYKKLGLNMRPTHATFRRRLRLRGRHHPDGGAVRLGPAQGRGAPAEWFDEYLGYHRIDGLVHKVDDDLLSATRVLCMDIRNAKASLTWPLTAHRDVSGLFRSPRVRCRKRRRPPHLRGPMLKPMSPGSPRPSKASALATCSSQQVKDETDEERKKRMKQMQEQSLMGPIRLARHARAVRRLRWLGY